MLNFAGNMIHSQALIQLRAFARQDGAILALVWIASFASVVYAPSLSGIGNGLAFATPFVAAWRLIVFRNSALDGVISFRRGLAYSWYTFFYASILFGILQFIYFKFLDNGVINAMIADTAKNMDSIYKANGMSQKDINDALSTMQSLSAIDKTALFLIQNLFVGMVLSVPIAAICARRTARNPTN